MIGMTASLSTPGIDRIQRNLLAEMRAAIPLALTYLKDLAIQVVVRMGAVDTLALLLSIYISAFRYSEYEAAAQEASDAYQSNPTKYPEIRKALGNPALALAPELRPNGPDEGWLGVAAGHGPEVEEGYESFYGNEVPARPFVQDTAHEGMPIVLELMKRALQGALK